MKLSTKAIYGLRAIFDLAYHSDGKPVQIREIAERSRIPIRFLEQILQDLKRAELVESKRGPKGGYLLACEPEKVTVGTVFAALEDLPELPDLREDATPEEGAEMITDQVCEELFARMRRMLEEVTVADLVHRGEELGLPRACYEGFVYVI